MKPKFLAIQNLALDSGNHWIRKTF